jgi:outer membrane protein assembly factor BamB
MPLPLTIKRNKNGINCALLLDLYSSAQCWSPGVQGVSTPALAGEVIWLTTNTGDLVLLEASTGTEQARFSLSTTPSLSAPAVIEDVAYIPCRGPHLLAMGLDGQLRWQITAAGQPTSWLDQTPILAGEYLIVVFNPAGRVIALRLADG